MRRKSMYVVQHNYYGVNGEDDLSFIERVYKRRDQARRHAVNRVTEIHAELVAAVMLPTDEYRVGNLMTYTDRDFVNLYEDGSPRHQYIVYKTLLY